MGLAHHHCYYQIKRSPLRHIFPPELRYFYMLVLTTISSLQEAFLGLSQPEDDISLQHFNIPVVVHVSDKRFRSESDHLCNLTLTFS